MHHVSKKGRKKGRKERERGEGSAGRKKHAGTSSFELDDVSRIEPICIQMHWPPVYTCLAPHHYHAHKVQVSLSSLSLSLGSHLSLLLSAVLRTIATELTFSSLHIPDDFGHAGHEPSNTGSPHTFAFTQSASDGCAEVERKRSILLSQLERDVKGSLRYTHDMCAWYVCACITTDTPLHEMCTYVSDRLPTTTGYSSPVSTCNTKTSTIVIYKNLSSTR